MRFSMLLAVLLVAGCGETRQATPPEKATAAQPTGPETRSALSDDDQVRLAVFLDLLETYEDINKSKPDPERVNALYLAVGVGDPDSQDGRHFQWEDPSDAVMTAVGERPIPIKKYSQCEPDPMQCSDRTTGKPGIVLRVGPLKWLDKDTATLEAGHYTHGFNASGMELEVQRKGDKWEITYTGASWVS